MTRRTLTWGVATLLLAAAVTLAQAPQPQRPAQPGTAASQEPPPAYSYSPDGRRDPFVSLLRRGSDPTRGQSGRPAEGVAALLVNEITLKGILNSRGQFVALVQGPDTRTHIVRANDRLLDGNVRAITADTMILMQDVNDPLLPTRQREVRKSLRAAAEQK